LKVLGASIDLQWPTLFHGDRMIHWGEFDALTGASLRLNNGKPDYKSAQAIADAAL
jgi:hypothetical protein